MNDSLDYVTRYFDLHLSTLKGTRKSKILCDTLFHFNCFLCFPPFRYITLDILQLIRYAEVWNS
jgi:hypothetical protein